MIIEIVDSDDEELSYNEEVSDDDEAPQVTASTSLPELDFEQCDHDLKYIMAHAMMYLNRAARKAREHKCAIDWKLFTALVIENSLGQDFRAPYKVKEPWIRLIQEVYYDLIHKDPGPAHDEDRMDEGFDGPSNSESRS